MDKDRVMECFLLYREDETMSSRYFADVEGALTLVEDENLTDYCIYVAQRVIEVGDL